MKRCAPTTGQALCQVLTIRRWTEESPCSEGTRGPMGDTDVHSPMHREFLEKLTLFQVHDLCWKSQPARMRKILKLWLRWPGPSGISSPPWSSVSPSIKCEWVTGPNSLISHWALISLYFFGSFWKWNSAAQGTIMSLFRASPCPTVAVGTGFRSESWVRILALLLASCGLKYIT